MKGYSLLALLISLLLIACEAEDNSIPTPPITPPPISTGNLDSLLISISIISEVTDTSLGKLEVKTVGGLPPYRYLWSNSETTNSISNLAAGTYTVTVTDSLNNYKVDSALISDLIVTTEIVRVSANIGMNTTWKKDSIYHLAARITVLDGATLTIEPGTIIKAERGTGVNAKALMVARGGKLMAEGTSNEPIIFTSVTDEITSGQIISPNLTSNINGLWGGVIVLGKSPISGLINVAPIEGVPTSDLNGRYGGSDPADISGVLKYISIRHGGSSLGGGNEINGLTLGGVGNGTVIDHIEIVGNLDDGIQWLGGSVNVTNSIVWNAGDDAIDTDQAWSGTLDNFVVITSNGHCLELDGPEGGLSGRHTIKNGTIVASGDGVTSSDLINTDNNSDVSLENIHFTSIVAGQTINRTVSNPGVSFSNITLDLLAGTNIDDYIADGSAPVGITSGTIGKANVLIFGWTWASQAGKLNGL